MCSKVFRDVPWNTGKCNVESDGRVCVFEGFINAWLEYGENSEYYIF